MATITVDQVRQYRIDSGAAGPMKPGEYRVSVSPYREILDARNYWTYLQDTATIEPPVLIPDVPPVALDPTQQTFLVSGGSGTFTVTTTGEGTSGTWTVDKDGEATWLHLDAPPLHEPQSTTSGTVSYTVDANPTGNLRAGHFYVNGKTFTVNQSI